MFRQFLTQFLRLNINSSSEIILALVKCIYFNQMFAVNVIWTMLNDRTGWESRKRELETQISSREPFIESFPSLIIHIIIIHVEGYIKGNESFPNPISALATPSISSIMFLVSFYYSTISAGHGIMSYFRRGAGHFLPSTGLLKGLLSPKALLALTTPHKLTAARSSISPHLQSPGRLKEFWKMLH